MSAPFPPGLVRQAGHLSPAEQTRLAAARVTVLGLGGVGGVAAELLARAGVGELVLADGEAFEPSNLNRQVGALRSTLGEEKARVMARRLAGVNPALRLRVGERVSGEEAAAALLAGAAAGVLAMDTLLPAVAAWRAARQRGLALVEALALPVLQVRVYAPAGPDPEDGLPSQGQDLALVDPDALGAAYARAEAARLADGQGGPLALAAPLALAQMQSGQVPSLGPLVWLAGSLAALETLKILLGRGRVAWFPAGAALDPWAWELHPPPGE
ncbi:MAG: ThiF family adenylyltransferase [Deltaproteobacteria bacterium]|nr:ThiF family adenylyltransferase [Deltaproteobacteria bacterium]